MNHRSLCNDKITNWTLELPHPRPTLLQGCLVFNTKSKFVVYPSLFGNFLIKPLVWSSKKARAAWWRQTHLRHSYHLCAGLLAIAYFKNLSSTSRNCLWSKGWPHTTIQIIIRSGVDSNNFLLRFFWSPVHVCSHLWDHTYSKVTTQLLRKCNSCEMKYPMSWFCK